MGNLQLPEIVSRSFRKETAMPKLAGRGVFFAALAVPFALAAAPLTASADEPDDVVITDQMVAGGVATPDGAAAMSSATTTTAIEESDDLEEIHQVQGDWYGPESFAVVNSPEAQDVVEDAAEDAVEEEDSEESTEETSTEAVAIAPAHQMSVVEADDDIVDWADNGAVGATYEELAAYAGADGAWVSSTESGAFSDEEGGLSGGDTAVWYEEVTAAAGSDGAFVESTESGAFESDGWSHGDVVDFDDDVTGASYEHNMAHAGDGGAWVENVDAAAFELD
jgi:hypothetical protein